MRIAFLNWNNRRFGGTGSYLSTILPALHAAGHDVALWYEVDSPSDHPVLPIPLNVPVWSVSNLGLDVALDALRTWRPDLLFAHGLRQPSVERQALDVAPAVFFAHDYHGTCISGHKTMTLPVVAPCDRAFGWRCMAEYFPRRCGGLSPVTMVKQFRLQQQRLDLLSRYGAIVTHSSHMQREYVNNGFPQSRVFNVKCAPQAMNGDCVPPRQFREAESRLLFAGRMDRLKGGFQFLRSLPAVRRQLDRPLKVTFAGDGPARRVWEAEASALRRTEPEIQVLFRGWLSSEALDELYMQSDLLVLPSVWPEPLSLVGLEARRHGLPAVAFDVGGISDWLTSGVNGILAPGNPPTNEGLANAIVAALKNSHTYEQLSHGAKRSATEFTLEEHLRRLMHVFESIAG